MERKPNCWSTSAIRKSSIANFKYICSTKTSRHPYGSVVDPDPAFQVSPDDQKMKNKEYGTAEIFLIFFLSKIAIYLSLGLHKGHQATEDAFSPQKRTSST